MTEQTIPSLISVGIAAIIGLLILWWGAACKRGTFPKNHILGVRTPTTLRSNEAWVIAHRAGAPQLLIAGWGIITAALVATVFTLILNPVPAVPLVFTLAFVWALGWIISSSGTAARAARSFRGNHDQTPTN